MHYFELTKVNDPKPTQGERNENIINYRNCYAYSRSGFSPHSGN